MATVYHIVRKNVEGVYLLSEKNNKCLTTTDRDLALWTLSYLVDNCSKNDRFVLFSQEGGSKYLQILREM